MENDGRFHTKKIANARAKISWAKKRAAPLRQRMQIGSKTPFWIFFLNEIARQTVSIFFAPPTKDHCEGLTEPHSAPGRSVCNRNLGQDYEKNSFGGRLVGGDRPGRRGTSGGCGERCMPLRRRSLQGLFVPRPLSPHRLLQPLHQLLP